MLFILNSVKQQSNSILVSLSIRLNHLFRSIKKLLEERKEETLRKIIEDHTFG